VAFAVMSGYFRYSWPCFELLSDWLEPILAALYQVACVRDVILHNMVMFSLNTVSFIFYYKFSMLKIAQHSFSSDFCSRDTCFIRSLQ
jgi:hypothetical protein